MYQSLQTTGPAVSEAFVLTGSRFDLRALTARVGTRVHHLLCALAGHERFVFHGERRMSLRCGLCGNETRGWQLTLPRPTPRHAGDPQRHMMLARPRQATLIGKTPMRLKPAS